MKKLLILCLILTSVSSFARYSCYVDVKVFGFSGKTSSFRVTNNPLFNASSSSVISFEDGSIFKPYDSYNVRGVEFRKYDIEQSFSLLQRSEKNVDKFLLHTSSMMDPDPIYGQIHLLKKGATLDPGSDVTENGSMITIKTSYALSRGEQFYSVECE